MQFHHSSCSLVFTYLKLIQENHHLYSILSLLPRSHAGSDSMCSIHCSYRHSLPFYKVLSQSTCRELQAVRNGDEKAEKIGEIWEKAPSIIKLMKKFVRGEIQFGVAPDDMIQACQKWYKTEFGDSQQL